MLNRIVHRARWRLLLQAICALILTSTLTAAASGPAQPVAESDDMAVALDLADLLRAARAVISAEQDLINNPDIGDKGLTGKAVLTEAIERFKKRTGRDPLAVDEKSRHGRLLQAQMAAITEVVDENQDTINRVGIGFKGFVPAVFGRLVNERFEAKVGDEVAMKVTAPAVLIRNRKARPDEWESEVIRSKLLSPQWPKDKIYAATTSSEGHESFRVLVPEYYTAGCLTCHGEPKGEIDVTGYPKEGGKLGDLGGVISITLFH